MSLAVLPSDNANKPAPGRADRKADTSEETGNKFKSLLKDDKAGAAETGSKGAIAARFEGDDGSAETQTMLGRYHHLFSKAAAGPATDKVAAPDDSEEAQADGEAEASQDDETTDVGQAASDTVTHGKVPDVAIQAAAVVPTSKAPAASANGEEHPAENSSQGSASAAAEAHVETPADGDTPQPAGRNVNAASAAAAHAAEARPQAASPRGENQLQAANGQQSPAANVVAGAAETDNGSGARERGDDRQNHGQDRGSNQTVQTAGGNRVAGVTVLSQQTAPAPVQNMTPTATALTESLAQGLNSPARADLPEHAAMQAHTATKSGMVTTLRIQLQPIELGTVTARISGVEGQLSIEITVDNAEARHRLTSDSDSIVSALRGMGIDVDRVTVQQTQNSSANTPNGAGRGSEFAQSQGERGERQGAAGQGQRHEGNGTARGQGNETSDPAGSGLYI
ncbi:MAG: flagellar hook-length control protein FliK [Brucellaceae bacterium]|nr:flagellar hook-length control protein FliK [Brucellaceae bacterium]